MSYCHWGSDSYRSDVYVYESGLGFQTHVASEWSPAEWCTTDLSERVPST